MFQELGKNTLTYFLNEELYKNYMTKSGLTIILGADPNTLTNVYVENIIRTKIFSNCKFKYNTLTNTILDTSNYTTIHVSNNIRFLYNGYLPHTASGPLQPTPSPPVTNTCKSLTDAPYCGATGVAEIMSVINTMILRQDRETMLGIYATMIQEQGTA